MNKLYAGIADHEIKLSSYKRYKYNIILIDQHKAELANLLSSINHTYEDTCLSFKNNAINQIIRNIQLEQSKLEHMLSEITIQRALTDSLITQISLLEETSQGLKILVKELSPTEGLIARGMMGFISNYITQINNFIRKVWTYPLNLSTCNMEIGSDIDLDYKFGVCVHGKSVSPDVSRCSSGMKEIIDLGFRLVMMKHLKLDEYPIYLDEFSARFDAAHKKVAYMVIANLITQSNYSQLFIVSHSEDAYSSVSESELLVLCSANVILPQGSIYNKHVQIK